MQQIGRVYFCKFFTAVQGEAWGPKRMGGVLRDETILAVEEEAQIARLTAVLFVSLLLECVQVVKQEAANKQVSCVGDLERQSC